MNIGGFATYDPPGWFTTENITRENCKECVDELEIFTPIAEEERCYQNLYLFESNYSHPERKGKKRMPPA